MANLEPRWNKDGHLALPCSERGGRERECESTMKVLRKLKVKLAKTGSLFRRPVEAELINELFFSMSLWTSPSKPEGVFSSFRLAGMIHNIYIYIYIGPNIEF